MIREGTAKLSGAQLRYRLSGTPSTFPLLVFENGLGASFEYWAWVEQALAPHAQLLFYDRAGIGGSKGTLAQTATAISQQFSDLLSALTITPPVIVVGHSFGGLMCALHAAQQPNAVAALIEFDPTPDQDDVVLDRQLKMVNVLIRLAILCARLGIPDPVFSPSGKRLPEPDGALFVKRSFGSVASLRAAMAEKDLLPEIRRILATTSDTKPRLVVSASESAELSGLAKLLINSNAIGAVVDRMQKQHRRSAARGKGSTWCTLPYDHAGLVWSQSGASSCAAKILDFSQGFNS